MAADRPIQGQGAGAAPPSDGLGADPEQLGYFGGGEHALEGGSRLDVVHGGSFQVGRTSTWSQPAAERTTTGRPFGAAAAIEELERARSAFAQPSKTNTW